MWINSKRHEIVFSLVVSQQELAFNFYVFLDSGWRDLIETGFLPTDDIIFPLLLLRLAVLALSIGEVTLAVALLHDADQIFITEVVVGGAEMVHQQLPGVEHKLAGWILKKCKSEIN